MKSRVHRIGLGLSFLLVFLVGCVVGLMGSSYLYYRHVYPNVVDTRTHDLASQLNTLSHLRMGEIEPVVSDLEMLVDGNVVDLARGIPHIPETDRQQHPLGKPALHSPLLRKPRGGRSWPMKRTLDANS